VDVKVESREMVLVGERELAHVLARDADAVGNIAQVHEIRRDFEQFGAADRRFTAASALKIALPRANRSLPREQLGSDLRDELSLVTGTAQFERAGHALSRATSDGGGAVGTAAGDFIERHLPLIAVGQAHDGHAEVQQVGDDGKQRDFLTAMLRGRGRESFGESRNAAVLKASPMERKGTSQSRPTMPFYGISDFALKCSDCAVALPTQRRVTNTLIAG
jgi:hypothetical protein